MKKSLLKSTVIMDLKEKIDQGNHRALQEFWYMVENKGTPLIEEIGGDNENALVTFIYRADEEIENVVLIPPVGGGNFLKNKMERLLGTNLWYITYEIRNDIRFYYYFSQNDSFDDNWEKRYKNSTHDKFNKKFIVFTGDEGEKDRLLSVAIMPKNKEHVWVKERNDVPKGKLHEHMLKCDKLEKDRRVRIYTPHGYEDVNQPYGYLLLTDGDEYITMLSAATVLDNLIADKKIPPIIAVFIDSTETREEELMCNDIFGDIIVNELIPWVKVNYNISSKANDAVIGGLSLGGLTASYLGYKYSKVFGNVLSQSGSYWYKPDSYEGTESDCWLSIQFKSIDKLPLKFYLNVGIIEPKEDMIDTNIKFRDELIAKGYTVDFEYFNSGHDYLSWGETLANGLISLIGIK